MSAVFDLLLLGLYQSLPVCPGVIGTASGPVFGIDGEIERCGQRPRAISASAISSAFFDRFASEVTGHRHRHRNPLPL